MLELAKLLLYDLSCVLLASVHLFLACIHAQVVLLHFEAVVLHPAFLYGLGVIIFLLFHVLLRLTFLDHITEKQLSVKGFHLVLGVMHFLVCLLDGNTTLLLVKRFFLCIYLTAREL